MQSKKIISLLTDAPATQTGAIVGIFSGVRTIQSVIKGTGAVSATVEFYGSNVDDLTTGILLATATLSGTNTDTAGAVITAEYFYMWAKITAISGTAASVSATVGV